MYTKFISLKFKNINSYSGKVTSFDFLSGLNLIAGDNGSGKSTILDALCYCMFGEAYRDINLYELINRTNKQNLWTQLEFQIEKDLYRITRSMKPDGLEILQNGLPIQLLPTKKLIQDELNKILGIDLFSFKQVISLTLNFTKPFFTLPADKKRNIIENIFNIKVYGKMGKTAKTQHSSLTSTFNMYKKDTIDLKDKRLKSD